MVTLKLHSMQKRPQRRRRIHKNDKMTQFDKPPEPSVPPVAKKVEKTSFWFMHVDLFGHGFPMSVLPNVIWCICWLSFTHGYDNGQIVSNSLEASKLAINHPVAARQELNQRFFADLLCMLQRMHKLYDIAAISYFRFFPEEPLTSDHPKDEHNIINNVKQGKTPKKTLPPIATIHLRSCGFHMTILRKFGPPLQWSIVPVGPGFHGKYVVQLWYRFLAKGDSLHGDELLFYYRPHKDIWGMLYQNQSFARPATMNSCSSTASNKCLPFRTPYKYQLSTTSNGSQTIQNLCNLNMMGPLMKSDLGNTKGNVTLLTA
ncbi:hypothetical protein JHK84_032168 [Glycine max]|nr:hypothetical protein JHK84_032168 [Glycine max]